MHLHTFRTLHWPSVLWHCWLGIRKCIQYEWCVCWCDYLSARCKCFAHVSADTTETSSSLA